MPHPLAAFGDYRNTPAPDDDPRVDAVALAVCSTGGHIPNRDRPLLVRNADTVIGEACDFHRRMAAGYIRVADAASPPPSTGRVIPSRRTDPPTSHTAAGQVVVRAGTQRARLLAAFGGPMPILSGGAEADGLTDYEAAVLAFGVDLRSEYAKRCSELRDAGLIEVVDADDGTVLTRRSHAGGPARIVSRITAEGSKVLTELRTRPSTTATHPRSNDA